MPEETGVGEVSRAGWRRRRVPGGRPRRYEVRVTLEEDARLVALAERYRMSVPRLLYTAAVSGGAEGVVARAEAVQELFAIERLLANIANNVNQVAKVANSTGEVAAQTQRLIDAVLSLVDRIEDGVDAVAGA